MEKNVEKGAQSLLMDDLPYEVLTMIFSKLAMNDIFSVILTCKKFRDVVTHNSVLWRLKCSETFIVGRHNKYQRGRYLETNPYQQCRISSNWRKGYYREMVTAHSQTKYIPWLSLQSEYLLLSTANVLTCYPRDKKGLFNHKKKCLWQLLTPIVKRRGIRTNDVSRFIVKDDVIVCGNRDGCMAIYSLNDDYHWPPIPKFRDHVRDCHKGGNVEISAVECFKNEQETHLISCSVHDNVIKFWRKEHKEWEPNNRSYFECIREFNTSIEGAKCMHLNSQNNILAVGLDNNSRPLLINTERGISTYYSEEYFNVQECVRDIQWIDDNTVAFVRHRGLLSVFDRRSNKLVYNSQDPLGSSLYSVQTDGARAAVTGCAQLSRCVLYDLRVSNNFVQMLFTQRCSSPVYSLAFDANVLVAAADRGVGVLNFNVNTAGVRNRDYASMVRNKTQ